MKRKLRGLVPLLVIAIGLLVLFYPTISNFLVMRNASRAVTNYDAATQSISDKQYQQMLAAAHAYNEQLAANNAGATDALAAAVNTEAVSKEYNNLLNLSGDGMMGYITMPRLHETLPIYHGTAEKVLQIGIGHLEQTSSLVRLGSAVASAAIASAPPVDSGEMPDREPPAPTAAISATGFTPPTWAAMSAHIGIIVGYTTPSAELTRLSSAAEMPMNGVAVGSRDGDLAYVRGAFDREFTAQRVVERQLHAAFAGADEEDPRRRQYWSG